MIELTEIDIILRLCTPKEIKDEMRLAEFSYDCSETEEMKDWWFERLKEFEFADDLVQYCMDNHLPLQREPRIHTLEQILGSIDQLERNYNELANEVTNIESTRFTPPLKKKEKKYIYDGIKKE